MMFFSLLFDDDLNKQEPPQSSLECVLLQLSLLGRLSSAVSVPHYTLPL